MLRVCVRQNDCRRTAVDADIGRRRALCDARHAVGVVGAGKSDYHFCCLSLTFVVDISRATFFAIVSRRSLSSKSTRCSLIAPSTTASSSSRRSTPNSNARACVVALSAQVRHVVASSESKDSLLMCATRHRSARGRQVVDAQVCRATARRRAV